jgi:membrane-associated protease RseP (regulator of RpoE activity)
MDYILSVVMAVALAFLILLVITALHELGHFLACLILGIKVKQVFIGWPKPPKVSFKLWNITWTVSPYLIMGGVDVVDDEFAATDWWRKLIVALSGPAMSIAAGVLVALLFFGWEAGTAISREFTAASIQASGQLISLNVSAAQLSGPIALLVIMARLFLLDPIKGVIFIWILLNLALAIVNLLPLPALDGGQAVSAILLGCVRQFWPQWQPRALILEKRLRTATFYLLLAGMVLLLAKDILATIFH